MRRTHIDELPQLWNILIGDMSLLGPRPERPEFVSVLEKEIPGYSKRLLVRPGLSGLAQVQLPADTDLDSVRAKVAYDLCYMERLSFWLDLRILAATVLDVFEVPSNVTSYLCALPASQTAENCNNLVMKDNASVPELGRS
jgi:lipopolysaccharide/colanic/teichoic acid biosynthesis glycosyltransferase